MVLGLSIGKKGKNSKKDGQNGSVLRTSPSLPSLQTQGLQWPETLVDMPAVKLSRQSNAAPLPTTAATTTVNRKRSLSLSSSHPFNVVSYHKPFRAGQSPTKPMPMPTGEVGAIARMYTQPRPTSGFSRHGTYPALGPNRSIRRKVAPTFNMMVVGAKGTGKTSLLKLLLDTCDIAPSATPEQRTAVDKFIQGSSKRTRALHTASVEVLEPRFDRVLLTLIDTPGLDFSVGHELETDRAVSQLVKYIDLQFQDTMGEESKVVRQSKGDQHIHLCIYMIDPDTVMPASQRRATVGMPARTRSKTSFSLHNDAEESSSDDLSSADEYEEDAATPHRKVPRLTMAPVDIRVIKRLANRVNVLPVVSRGDTLIDSRLHAIKRAVKRDLQTAGVDFGVFSPQGHSATPSTDDVPPVPRRRAVKPPSSTGHGAASSTEKDQDDYGEPSDEDEERESRPVIKIKTTRARSNSRRRRDDSDEEVEAPAVPVLASPATANGANDANGHVVLKKMDLDDLLPFAIVVPEPELVGKRKKGVKKVASDGSADAAVDSPVASIAAEANSRAATPTRRDVAPPPSAFRSSMASPSSPIHSPVSRLPKPVELGKFVRKYRWGTIDVINPDHCDFMALRTTVLNTHLKALKTNTKDVLYEKYRTEKLLARRATRNITDEERRKLLRDLGA